MADKWQEALKILSGKLTKTAYNQHFKSTQAELNSVNQLIIYTTKKLTSKALQQPGLMNVLKQVVTTVYGDNITIAVQETAIDLPDPQPERIKVIDRRKPRYFTVDNELFDEGHAAMMKPSGLSVYLCLCRHADFNTNDCYPSYATVAKKCGMGRSTVIRHIKRLNELKYVSIEHNFNSNGDFMSNTFYLNELPILKG